MPLLELEPRIIRETENGTTWKMDDGTDNFLYIVKVEGSAYEMGYAQG